MELLPESCRVSVTFSASFSEKGGAQQLVVVPLGEIPRVQSQRAACRGQLFCHLPSTVSHVLSVIESGRCRSDVADLCFLQTSKAIAYARACVLAVESLLRPLSGFMGVLFAWGRRDSPSCAHAEGETVSSTGDCALRLGIF